MNLADISSAIDARLTADTVAGGLYDPSGSLINSHDFDMTFAGTTPPYVLIHIPKSESDDTFPTDAIEVEVDVELVIDRRWGTFADDSAILQRLEYLLHRWQMTLVGANATAMRRTDGYTNHDDTHRRYVERYEVRVEEA